MLQQKSISKLLSKGLTPITIPFQPQSQHQIQQSLTTPPQATSTTSSSPAHTTANASLLSTSSPQKQQQKQQSPTLQVSPISISLLSTQGIPLITVSNRNELSHDSLRIYSLLAYNSLETTTAATHGGGGDNWNIVDFEGIKCIIAKLYPGRGTHPLMPEVSGGDDEGIEIIPGMTKGEDGGSRDVENKRQISQQQKSQQQQRKKTMCVVLFYDAYMSDAVAKLKLDGIVDALNDGLIGYNKV
ncbi:uncharacterized protein J8A68_001547 [[Candida] subhashii]|uniref:Uncharacterized protein n=1 Tax=[Candida] subhashii TaxID=561895 RepID=A0A8J5V429_9ASCO|nr:uncharacterized protein J8A68_001547 [[Candida] subhashii]KAG7664909.1 hypothetical protein J8A68_001547 [[Candida] subhashii]